MRIRDRVTRGVSATTGGPAKAKSPETAAGTARPGGADTIRVSDRGREVQRARGLALHAPEIRESLVEEVSGQIENGEYTVTGEDVAPKMIQEHLADVTR